ncbi:Cna B-type domain-containing protein, partial [Floricoccus tropicus]|uniref:Cna B-type domain-containing protein n=1 Tax=Floricoccus tropicus TaxID=1859473 RepID=UPI0009F5F8C5
MINKIQKPVTLLMLLLMLPFTSIGEVVALTVDQSNKNDVVLLDENQKEAKEVTTDETGTVDFYAGVTNGDTLRLTTNQPVELSIVDTGLTITQIAQTTYDLSWTKVGSNTSKVKLKILGDSDIELKLASKDNESTKTLLIQKALAVAEKTEESTPLSESSKDEETTPLTSVVETKETINESEVSNEDLKSDDSSDLSDVISSIIEPSSASSSSEASSPSSSSSQEQSSAVPEVKSSTKDILPSKSIVETAKPKIKVSNAKLALAATNFDAAQYVTNVDMLAGGVNPNGKTYPDSQSFQLKYQMNFGNGNNIDTTQPYIMNLPTLFSKFETTRPIRIEMEDGTFIGEVTIQNGKINIQFNDNVKSYNNVKINFSFWSGADKSKIDYTNGNDISFSLNDGTTKGYHVNFSKTSSSGSSGQSAIAKNIAPYNTNADETEITWRITVNKGGYLVNDSYLYDVVKNLQEYIPGSMNITYRNGDGKTLRQEKVNPVFIQQPDGSRVMSFHFGKLTPNKKNTPTGETYDPTSLSAVYITYNTKLIYNDAPQFNDSTKQQRWPNTAYSYDGDPNNSENPGVLIDSSAASAGWRGQEGGGTGDRLINILGTKVWNDGENQDGKRPDSLQVVLYRNDSVYRRVDVQPDKKTDNTWNYRFDNIPYSDGDGNVYTYTVKEENVPDGYSEDVTNPAPNPIYDASNKDKDGYKIINSYTPKLTQVKVLKKWDDNSNQNNTRPDSITLNLFANGEPALDKDGEKISQKISAPQGDHKSDTWAYTFENLPKNKDGKTIEYTVSESEVAGYKSDISLDSEEDGKFNYTITNTQSTTLVEGQKIWDDSSNQDGKRPASITIQLLANGIEAKDSDGNLITKEVKSSDSDTWNFEFKDLPKYYNSEIVDPTLPITPIMYTFKEVNVPDGYSSKVSDDGKKITNSRMPEITDISAKKVWNDKDDIAGFRPESIEFQLYKQVEGDEKVAVGTPQTTTKNDWNTEWRSLPKYEKGKVITYSVEELNVPEKYKSSIETDKDNPNNFIVTNSYVPETINISVKKVWDDKDDTAGLRPEKVEFQLYKQVEGDEKVAVGSPLTATKDDWSADWKSLSKYEKGKQVSYSIEELNVPEKYKSSIETDKDNPNNFIVTNSYVPETVSIKGIKVWEDKNNQDGKRPESIMLNLLANGQPALDKDGKEIIQKIVAPENNANSNEWLYSFDNLPMYKKGSEIKYSVDEVNIPEGYTKEVDDSDKANIIITNSHIPEQTSIIVNKFWEDEDNQDHIRPLSIQVKLFANDKDTGVVKTIIPDATGNWTTTFDNLDKKESGLDIRYSLEEVVPEGYESKINGTIITNIHKPTTVKIRAEKVWDDEDDKDNIRPESVQFQLYRVGTDGKKTTVGDPVTLSNSTEWTNLPEKENGTKIKYEVEEVSVKEGYTSSAKEVSDGVWVVTNSHKPTPPIVPTTTSSKPSTSSEEETSSTTISSKPSTSS